MNPQSGSKKPALPAPTVIDPRIKHWIDRLKNVFWSVPFTWNGMVTYGMRPLAWVIIKEYAWSRNSCHIDFRGSKYPNPHCQHKYKNKCYHEKLASNITPEGDPVNALSCSKPVLRKAPSQLFQCEFTSQTELSLLRLQTVLSTQEDLSLDIFIIIIENKTILCCLQ